MIRVGGNELDGGVDATGVMPPGGGLFRVIDVDFDEVGSFAEVFSEVIVKGDVAVGSVTELMPIDGDCGITIDAIEVDGDLLASKASGELKLFLIPTNTADSETAFVLLSSLLGRSVFP